MRSPVASFRQHYTGKLRLADMREMFEQIKDQA
jgi:hypothetical protein